MFPPNITQPRTTSLSSAELGCSVFLQYLRDLSEGGRPREVGKIQDFTIHECPIYSFTLVFCIKIINFVWDFLHGLICCPGPGDHAGHVLLTAWMYVWGFVTTHLSLPHAVHIVRAWESREVFLGLSKLSEIIALYLVCEWAGPLTCIL
jgi:hypothetical protein